MRRVIVWTVRNGLTLRWQAMQTIRLIVWVNQFEVHAVWRTATSEIPPLENIFRPSNEHGVHLFVLFCFRLLFTLYQLSAIIRIYLLASTGSPSDSRTACAGRSPPCAMWKNTHKECMQECTQREYTMCNFAWCSFRRNWACRTRAANNVDGFLFGFANFSNFM